MIIHGQQKEEKRLTSSYLTETYKRIKEGRRIVIHQLKAEYATDLSCINAFEQEMELMQDCRHPNILRPTASAQKGCCLMETPNGIALDDYLHDNPSFVTNGKELDRIVSEVTEAVAFLHAQGRCHLHLHPHNILLTKGDLTVKLTNPQEAYATMLPHLGVKADEFTAPELMTDNGGEDYVRSDIYSLGKLIAWLYDMSALPYRYRKAVQKAVQAHPDKRPKNLKELNGIIQFSRMKMMLFKGVMWIILTLLACGGLYWLTSTSGEEDIHFVKPTANNTYVYDSISGESYYISDSIMEANTAAMEREKERLMEEYTRKVNDIFRRAFREKAQPVIEEIYTEGSMAGDERSFSALNKKGMMKLQEIQEELAAHYELDAISASKVAAEVIDELSRQRVSQLQQEE